MNTEYNQENNYETFFEEVWDYVSDHIVDDDKWEKYLDKFHEITYDIYQFYVKTSYISNTVEERVDYETHERVAEIVPVRIYPMSSKVCARMIESFVKNFSSELS